MAGAAKRARNDGAIWIALSAAALAAIVAMMAILGILIAYNSFLALWPRNLEQVKFADGSVLLGAMVNDDLSPEGKPRLQYKVANRDLNGGADFRWVEAADVASSSLPAEAVVLKRMENGEFYGFLKGVRKDDGETETLDPDAFHSRLTAFQRRWSREVEPIRAELASLGDTWQDAHLLGLKADYEAGRARDSEIRAEWEAKLAASKADEAAVKKKSEELLAALNQSRAALESEKAVFAAADGRELPLPLSGIVEAVWPNRLGFPGKVRHFFLNSWNLLTQYPRDANTEGGLFPAIFGTVMLVFLMAISAFPLGVAAGVYLREYARDGLLSRAARVAVNNLAGVPSIVYGIFGLGFFVYGVGGTIDQLFWPERVAAGISTFGGGGIVWSSLTLGLLTLPVVIVATEEALTTVPSEIRQGSLALGATRFQTLWRVVLPMASPGIMTGFILAMARAAGEVAPLMLTGVVKSAPGLALDSSWPYIHLERKFMHLGFHIYDMGFQSPNVEASKPLVYLTTLVLLTLVFLLNLAAISLRRRMRDKYAMRGF